ncbi:MAG TPA: Lrp/AsnC family transcriptional regulator [Candidatus Bathyarchaeota archaeon]|nr:Lrp/AsnC family transcriptional regulator [Candidatus Bathyarchaeota archaeon]
MVRISNIKLLRILRENSRMPYLEIARILGVSETAVRKRVKRLLEEGVIRKFTVEIDPKKVGYQVVAMIGLDTKPEALISVLEMLKKLENVQSLYSSSGDHMIMMECWFKDYNELSRFIKSLEGIEGTTRICPAIILEKIK